MEDLNEQEQVREMRKVRAALIHSLEEASKCADRMMEVARYDQWTPEEHAICSDADDTIMNLMRKVRSVRTDPRVRDFEPTGK